MAAALRPFAPEPPPPSAERELVRRLGVFPATNIVVANMIGTGIFTTSGLLVEHLGDLRLLLALWLAGGLLSLAGALC